MNEGNGMRINVLVFSVVLCLSSAVAQAESDFFGVGDRLPEISLQDQYDEDGAVDSSTRILLFSRDMDGGKLLEEALADSTKGFLATANVIYVSDISGMPSLIARLFALPKMRKRPYPMLLDRSGDATQRLPDVAGKATVIFLRELRIERVEHVDSASGVQELIGLELPSDRDRETVP